MKKHIALLYAIFIVLVIGLVAGLAVACEEGDEPQYRYYVRTRSAHVPNYYANGYRVENGFLILIDYKEWHNGPASSGEVPVPSEQILAVVDRRAE